MRSHKLLDNNQKVMHFCFHIVNSLAQFKRKAVAILAHKPYRNQFKQKN